MEIIKAGKLPGERVFDTVCNNCKTHFKFKQNEGKITDDQRDGSYISVNCPLEGCGKRVDVDLCKGK